MPERPKIADAPLSVILLSQRGAGDVGAALQAWLAWLEQRPGEAELLLVLDDGQSPPDAALLTEARLRVIYHVAPVGVGAGLQTAIWLARHPLVMTAPADQQFQPHDAQRLFEQIDHVDLVCGIRVAGPPPWWLRGLGFLQRQITRVLLGYAAEPRASWLGWAGWWRRFCIRTIYGVKLRDPLCPLRLYRTAIVQRTPIQSLGGFAQIEVLAKANHRGCWMAETPVAWMPLPVEPVDATWAADVRVVRRWPDFGAPENCSFPAPTN